MISQIGSITSTELSGQLNTVFINTRDEISLLANKAPENIVESVHLIRKRLKFLRAFVKLTQYCTDRDQYKEINILLRNCGRLISDCRDAHVRGLLLEEFRQTDAILLHTPVIERLKTSNNRQTRKIENQLLSGRSVFDELMTDLSKKEIENYFSTLEAEAEPLFSGYSICYQKSYDAFHSELTNHEADLLHEWRKRTKDLQYQQEVLVESIPEDLPPSLIEISELCEILGRINDLYMLSDWIQKRKGKSNTSPLLEKILHQHELLQKEADERGHLLYRYTPDEYSHQLQKVVQE